MIITHEMQKLKFVIKVAVMEDGEVIEQGTVLDISLQIQQQLNKDFPSTQRKRISTKELKQFSHEQLLNLERWRLLSENFISSVLQQGTVDYEIIDSISVAANILFANVEIIQETQ